jgi:hypothetical protein
MSSDGTIIGRWGGRGDGPGYFKGAPHGLWIDSKGDIYIAEVAAEKAIHKFARI